MKEEAWKTDGQRSHLLNAGACPGSTLSHKAPNSADTGHLQGFLRNRKMVWKSIFFNSALLARMGKPGPPDPEGRGFKLEAVSLSLGDFQWLGLSYSKVHVQGMPSFCVIWPAVQEKRTWWRPGSTPSSPFLLVSGAGFRDGNHLSLGGRLCVEGVGRARDIWSRVSGFAGCYLETHTSNVCGAAMLAQNLKRTFNISIPMEKRKYVHLKLGILAPVGTANTSPF